MTELILDSASQVESLDTSGAVTCALRGRPKSEGITVHTWSCDGSLAGPLLLEFIVG